MGSGQPNRSQALLDGKDLRRKGGCACSVSSLRLPGSSTLPAYNDLTIIPNDWQNTFPNSKAPVDVVQEVDVVGDAFVFLS